MRIDQPSIDHPGSLWPTPLTGGASQAYTFQAAPVSCRINVEVSGNHRMALGAEFLDTSAPIVFSLGNWFKMIRVDASTSAAKMVNMQSRRNRTTKKLVGNPVRWMGSSPDVNTSISPRIRSGGPNNAIAGFYRILRKLLCCCEVLHLRVLRVS